MMPWTLNLIGMPAGIVCGSAKLTMPLPKLTPFPIKLVPLNDMLTSLRLLPMLKPCGRVTLMVPLRSEECIITPDKKLNDDVKLGAKVTKCTGEELLVNPP